jgi:WD40 repeat protein
MAKNIQCKGFIVVIILLTSLFVAKAQLNLPYLKLQIGHTETITALDISKDGKLIATSGQDKRVIIWDTKTGKAIKEFAVEMPPTNVVFLADNQHIIIALPISLISFGMSKFSLWNIKTGKEEFVYDFEGHSDISSAPSKSLIAIKAYNKTEIGDIFDGKEVVIYDLVGNKIVNDFNIGFSIDKPSQINITPTTRFLERNDSLYIISARQNLKSKEEFYFNMLRDTNFESKPIENLIEIWDVSTTSEPVKTIKVKTDIKHIATSNNGNYFATSYDSLIIVWNAKSYTPIDTFISTGINIRGLNLSTNGNRLLCYSESNKKGMIEVWNTQSGLKTATTIIKEESSSLNTIKLSSDGRYFVVADSTLTKIFNLNGDLIHVLTGSVLSTSPLFFSKNNRFLAPSPPSDNLIKAYFQKVKMYFGKLQYETKEEREEVMQAMAPYENEALRKIKFKQNIMAIWDLYNGINLWKPIHNGLVLLGREVARTGNATTLKSKKIKILNNSKATYGFDIFGQLFGGGKSETNEINSIYNMANKMNVAPSIEKLLINNALNDTLRLISIDSSNWIIINKQGYYKSSLNTPVLLHYISENGNVISFDQLDLKFNRPDIILKALASPRKELIEIYRKLYFARLEKNGLNSSIFNNDLDVPEADFVDRDSFEISQGKEKIVLRIHAESKKLGLKRFNVWVNEVPMFGQNGMTIYRKDHEPFDTVVNISLSAGRNKLETSVTNANGLESYRQPLFMNYIPPTSIKSKTWLIGIGVNQFADQAMNNLKYTEADIRSFTEGLKMKYTEGLEIDTLFNASFSLQSLLKLKNKLLSSGINDKVIIAYSGHGILDNDGKLYFPTSNMDSSDFKHPERKSISYEALENLLDGIPARNKLLLIDACHSGTYIRNDETIDETIIDSTTLSMLMDETFIYTGRGTGTTVIASSNGRAASQESSTLKHGFFMQSILDALNKYKSITVSQLKDFILEKVPILSLRTQKPTLRTENKEANFKVW